MTVHPVLKLGSRGPAVTRAKHAIAKWDAKPANSTPVYGPFFLRKVKTFQQATGLTADGVIGPATWKALEPYLPAPTSTLCYPIAAGTKATVCQGRHVTAGISHNIAFDFCCAPNSRVVAPEAGTITKLSGHPPWEDTWDTKGIYGWSVHLQTKGGYHYFITHLGHREDLRVGQKVSLGQLLGNVGNQKYRPDHTHIGVTSPKSEADALQRITAVSKAPKVWVL